MGSTSPSLRLRRRGRLRRDHPPGRRPAVLGRRPRVEPSLPAQGHRRRPPCRRPPDRRRLARISRSSSHGSGTGAPLSRQDARRDDRPPRRAGRDPSGRARSPPAPRPGEVRRRPRTRCHPPGHLQDQRRLGRDPSTPRGRRGTPPPRRDRPDRPVRLASRLDAGEHGHQSRPLLRLRRARKPGRISSTTPVQAARSRSRSRPARRPPTRPSSAGSRSTSRASSPAPSRSASSSPTNRPDKRAKLVDRLLKDARLRPLLADQARRPAGDHQRPTRDRPRRRASTRPGLTARAPREQCPVGQARPHPADRPRRPDEPARTRRNYALEAADPKDRSREDRPAVPGPPAPLRPVPRPPVRRLDPGRLFRPRRRPSPRSASGRDDAGGMMGRSPGRDQPGREQVEHLRTKKPAVGSAALASADQVEARRRGSRARPSPPG